MMKLINKILIANRGEIALRIQRTAHKMGIHTIAVYSKADQDAAFVSQAGEAVLLEGELLSETYLNIEKIIAVAREKGADAIHPGYGFLSENEKFINACNAAGIIFIGPSAHAVHAMGNKIQARETAVSCGVPVTPGITGTPHELSERHHEIGFPILIKAAAGGGGKGMKVVYEQAELAAALESTAREAGNYFGDDTVYMEKYITAPRHIEVQVLGDQHGHVVHLFDRECSVQRRHQKIIEEAPSPTLPDAVRNNICNAAILLAKSIHYYSAGTMEFLLAPDMQFYFLEMNTRIQVEHPVTELITGIDIVEQQIKIAQGAPLSFSQEAIRKNGHAIECRIYAEDPQKKFIPSPGKIMYYSEPSSSLLDEAPLATLRIDGMQLQSGDTVSADFDPMIAKLITWGHDRESARALMLGALDQYLITGIKTNIDFLQGFLQQDVFVRNAVSTKYLDEHLDTVLQQINDQKDAVDPAIIVAAGLLLSFAPRKKNAANIWQQIGYWRLLEIITVLIDEQLLTINITLLRYPAITFVLNGKTYETSLVHKHDAILELTCNGQAITISAHETGPNSSYIRYNGHSFDFKRTDILDAQQKFESSQHEHTASGNITSPMPGKVIKIHVTEGQQVAKGDPLIVVEAMKMENTIGSPVDGVVKEIAVREMDKVNTTEVLLRLASVPLSNPV